MGRETYIQTFAVNLRNIFRAQGCAGDTKVTKKGDGIDFPAHDQHKDA